MPAPVITNANITEILPTTTNAVLGAVTATNSPTSWAITNGNWDAYFAIDNSGTITAQHAATVPVTNLFLQSQNFETSAWSKTGAPGVGSPFATVLVTGGAATAPDGTNTGELISDGNPTVLFLTSGTSWTVPADWNSASNSIEVIGAGAGGGGGSAQTVNNVGGGGGGGGYSKVNNWVGTPGAATPIVIGAAGTGGAAGANGTAGGATIFNGSTPAASTVSANGGSPGLAPVNGGTGGAGGSIAGTVGAVQFHGGNGGTPVQGNSGNFAGGGGGAAGPNGIGGNARAGGGVANLGGNADAGFGGAGGAQATPGSPGAEYTSNPGGATAGAGGGAGAAGNVNGPAGGLYGGGGGGGIYQGGSGGPGGQGLIVITYFPTNFHRVTQQISGGLANTTYCMSAYLQAQTRTRGAIQIDDANNGAWAVYDLSGGVVGVAPQTFGTGWSNLTATISNVGNNWFRCTLVATSATATTITGSIMLDSGSGSAASSLNYGGSTATTGIFAWGAQFEQNNTFGPYVPTTTVTASQNGQPTGTYLFNVSATNSSGTGTGTVTINAIPQSLVAPPLSWYTDWRVPSTIFVPVSSTARLDTTDQYFSNFGSVIQPTFPHSVVSGATQSPSFYLLNDVQIYALTTPLTWMTPFGSPYPVRIPPYAPLGSADPAESFINFAPVAGSVPVVTSGTFTENLPITQGTVITTFQATSSPTSWAIVNGNFSNYFALSNSGVLTATTAAQQSATNNLLQSQAFDQATNWSPTGGPAADPGAIVVGPNTQAAPNGTVTADLLGEGTVSSFYRVTQTVSITANIQTVFSVYLKAQSRGRAYLQYDDGSGAGLVTTFDIAGGQIGVPIKTFGAGTPFSAFSSTITSVGNGWFRCALIGTMTPSTTLNLTIGIDNGSATQPESHTYVGGGSTVGIFAWGAQLEENTNAIGPYVATTTAPATQTGQPPGTYTLTVTATNTIGTSQPATETISAVQPLQPPVVTNQTATITEPLTQGQVVMTMVATNSPATWAITAGNSAGDFAIDNTGKITVTAAGAGLSGAANFSLTVQATNSAGSGTGTATINVQAASTGATFAELILGGGGYFTGIQMLPGGVMVIHNDSGSGYIRTTKAAGQDTWVPLLNTTNMPGQGTIWGWSNGELGGSWVLGNNSLGGSLYDVQMAPSTAANGYGNQTMYALWLGFMIFSTNSGITWTLMSNFPTANYSGDANGDSANRQDRFVGKRIRIDPANANRVIIATPANGFYITSNGLSGASATFTSLTGAGAPVPPNRNYGGCIDYDTTSGTTGGFTNRIALCNGNGVYISTNAGASFSLSGGSPTGLPGDALFTAGRYLICINNTAVWMLSGGSWFNVSAPSGSGMGGIAINPSDSNHVAVCNNTGGGGWNQGTISGNSIAWHGPYGFVSPGVNAGGTDVPWMVDIQYGGLSSFSACAFDTATAGANGAGRLWIMGGYTPLWIDLQSKTAADGNWVIATPIAIGTESTDGNTVRTFNSPSFTNVLCSVDDQQVFSITNPALPPPQGTPSPRARNTNASAWCMDVSESVPGVAFVLADGYYVSAGPAYAVTTNGGASWTQVPAPWTNTAGSGAGGNSGTFGGVCTCTTSSRFIAASLNASVTPIFTTNGGTNWQACSGLPTGQYATFFGRMIPMCNDASGNAYVYHNPGGTFRSLAGSFGTFTNMSTRTDIQNNPGADMVLRAVPGQTGHLFITVGFSFPGGPGPQFPSGNLFWTSTDGGATWTSVPNITDVWCFGFGQPHPSNPGVPTLWAYCFAGPNGATKRWGIWRSNDLGVSGNNWTRATFFDGGVNLPMVSLTGDMNNYQKCYISYAGGGFRYGFGIP